MTEYPVLNLQQLLDHHKGHKPKDKDRILHSRNSEDWVTWNFFQILLEQYPSAWWSHLVSVARRRNPDLKFPFDDQSLPAPMLWEMVCSPMEYETRSRKRMEESENPEWVSRANMREPVEGPSEIDVLFEHDKFIVFIEAKLGSDVSMRTKYDPQRNQIIRNIDCLISKAGNRMPIFWLLVKDQESTRKYVHLIDTYKRDPDLLARILTHRNAETLRSIARNLTIMLWGDFKDLVCVPGMDSETNDVKRELENRILSYPCQGISW